MKRATRVARNRVGLRCTQFVQHTRYENGRDDGTRTRYEQFERLLARPVCIRPRGTRGRSRTFINLFLRQAPRPSWATRACEWSERQDLNLRILAPKASPYGHLRNALIGMEN